MTEVGSKNAISGIVELILSANGVGKYAYWVFGIDHRNVPRQ